MAVMLIPPSYSRATVKFHRGKELFCGITDFTRRKFLQEFLSKYGDGKVKILSTSTPIIIGTPRSMTSLNPEMKKRIDTAYDQGLRKFNPCTQSDLIPEFTASPHPRFLGLAQSIRERREEKVSILSPLYKDVNTNM